MSYQKEHCFKWHYAGTVLLGVMVKRVCSLKVNVVTFCEIHVGYCRGSEG